MRKALMLFVAVALSLLATQPALAAPKTQAYFSFLLDKREAAKDEPVVARYQLAKPAKRVFITATDVEGGPLSFTFPQTGTANAQRTAGVITFTVPVSAGALSPLRMTLNVDGQLRGLNMLMITCDHPWFFEPRPDRCLFEAAAETPAAFQPFERGAMIWLKSTQSIWILYHGSSRVDRFNDLFIEGSPESDPAIVAPAGQVATHARLWAGVASASAGAKPAGMGHRARTGLHRLRRRSLWRFAFHAHVFQCAGANRC